MRDQLLAWFLTLAACGCVTNRENGKVSQNTVDRGDCLLIQCVSRPSPVIRQVVDVNGFISLPFNVNLSVAGMTLSEVGKSIAAAYQPTELPEPEFTVTRCRD